MGWWGKWSATGAWAGSVGMIGFGDLCGLLLSLLIRWCELFVW